MKQTGIIMSGNHPRLILDGTKTQTRRVVKGMALEWLQPNMFTPEYVADNDLCPYGQVGDRLWVRETWGYHGSSYYMNKNTIHISYKADGEKRDIDGDIYCSHCGLKTGELQTPKQNLKYPSNFNDLDEYEQLCIRDDLLRKWWKSIRTVPSIFMPRWASRITLEITEVRVERLNLMTDGDAHLEGVDNLVTFMLLWDRLNKKRGYEWTSNCWVWVLTFKLCQ